MAQSPLTMRQRAILLAEQRQIPYLDAVRALEETRVDQRTFGDDVEAIARRQAERARTNPTPSQSAASSFRQADASIRPTFESPALQDLRSAPEAAPEGSSPMAKLQARLDRQRWERGQAAGARRLNQVEAEGRQRDALAEAQREQQRQADRLATNEAAMFAGDAAGAAVVTARARARGQTGYQGGDASDIGGDFGRGFRASFDSIEATMEAGRGSFDRNMGMDSPAVRERIKDAEKRARLAQERQPDNFLGEFGGAVGNIVGSLVASGKQGAKTAAVGAGVGAGVGALAGGVGAVPGAVAGAGIGFTRGMVADFFITGAGTVMGELDDAVTETGERVDQNTIRGAGLIAGSLSAVLNSIGLKAIGKPFQGLVGKGVEMAIGRRLTQEVATNAASRGALRAAGAAYGTAIAGETSTEVLEEIIQIAAVDTAKRMSSPEFKTVFNDPKRRQEAFDQVVDTAVTTALGMTVVAAPGGFVGGIRQRGANRRVDDDGAPPIESPFRPLDRPGVREQSTTAAAQPTQADIDSPLSTDLVTAGKQAMADAAASSRADDILRTNAAPSIGSRVTVQGRVAEVADAIEDENGEAGVTLRFENGQTQKVYFNDLRDAGIALEPFDSRPSPLDEIVAPDPVAPPPVTPAARPTAAAPTQNRAVTGFDAREQVKNKIRRVESGGNDAAKNPNSSARGRYQFTDGTFNTYFQRVYGRAPSGAERTDAAVQERLMDALTDDNARALRKAGFKGTAGELYLAHFAGIGGARKLLSNPNGSAEAILGKAAADANGNIIRGKSAAEVIAWADRKMGGTSTAPGLTNPDNEDLTPDERIEFNFEEVDYSDRPSFLDEPIERDDPLAPAAPTVSDARPSLAELEALNDTPPPVSGAPMADEARSGEAPVSPVPQPIAPAPVIAETPSGKGLTIAGATPEQVATLKAALPEKASVIPNKDGVLTVSKKYEAAVRTALEPAAAPAPAAVDAETLDDVSYQLETISRNAPRMLGVRLDVKTDQSGIVIKDVVRQSYPSKEDSGTGAQAIEAVLRVADTAGLPVRLSAQDGSPGLIKYYERFGFTRTGTNDREGTQMVRAPASSSETPGPVTGGAPAPVAASPGAGANTAPFPVRQLRRDDNRYAVETGAVLTSASGRQLSPAPRYDDSTPRKEKMSLKRQAEWLLNEAVEEARQAPMGSSGNYAFTSLSREKADNLPPATWDLINETLFGDVAGPRAPAAPATPAPAAFVPDAYIEPLRAIIRDTRTSLNDTDGIARRLGVTPEQARSVMGALASRPNSGFRMTGGATGRLQRVATRTKPMTAMEFVRSLGGIASGSNDLRNVGRLGRYPGVINNKTGRTADEIGAALHEAGYFVDRDPSDPDQRPTESETIDFLDRASITPTYAGDYQPAERRNEDDPEYIAARDAILADAQANGIQLGEAEVDDALSYVASGETPEAALERALDDAAARSLELLNDDTGNAEYAAGLGVIYEGGTAEERGGPVEEGLTGSESEAGDAGRGSAPDAQPAGDAAPSSQEAVTAGATETVTPDQTDIFGTRAGDERTRLEREGQGRKKGTAPQRAAGSDGGLFDTPDTTGDMFSAPARAPATAPAAKPKPAGYGEKNKLVTKDRAEDLRAKMREKFKNLNSGVDPELMAMGTELAVFHIEAGARKFADFASAMRDDLGASYAKLRPYLRSWYNGARDMMEDLGAPVGDMDGPDEVRTALANLSDAPETATQPAEEGATDGLQGTVSQGDARAGAANVQRAPQNGQDGRTPTGTEPAGARDVPATGGRGERPAAGRTAGVRGTGTRDTDRVPPAERPDGRNGRTDTAAVPKRVTGQNWRIEPGALDESRGAAQKARDNVRAIELVNELTESGRPATTEEQAELAKYVGWGGLKNAFPQADGSFAKGFEKIGPRLRELLTDEQYDTARRSIQYAHYTSEKVVRPMWEAARRLGFDGGRVFEPGMGTGNFVGMMPAELAGNTQYAGLEFDYVTARIAQLLYPQSGIAHADFTQAPLAKNAYDLVIGNPPFSETVIRSDPEYGKLGFVLHDFFFAKSLDAVRPGGLLMFVTSAGTLNKTGTKAREWMAERADLVGAIRLPGNAFAENAGTSVTTDIVILRKRLSGEAAGDRSWIDTVPQPLPNRAGEIVQANVNGYFSTHQDMILGEQGMFDKLVSGDRYAVRALPGANIETDLAGAIAKLPVNIMGAAASSSTIDFDTTGNERKEGSFYIADDGRLMQHSNGVGLPVQGRGKGLTGGLSARDQQIVRELIPIRDALRGVLSADLAGDTARANAARAALNGAYDAFVAKNGPINKADISYRRPSVVQQESARSAAREEMRLQGVFFEEGSFDPSEMIEAKASLAEIAAARKQAREAAQALGREWDEGSFDPEEMPDTVIVKRPNVDAFMSDQEGYRLRSIEHYNDDTGTAEKSRLFTESVVSREIEPVINSINDAFLYSLSKFGNVNLFDIAARAGLSRQEAIAELGNSIYLDPTDGETWQTRENYLSGNVRQKLEQARAAAARDPDYRRNVEALEAVQPAPLGPADISAGLGMPWIPSSTVEDFAKHLGLAGFTARYRPKMAMWNVDGNRNNAAATSDWGTAARGGDAVSLIANALNRQDPKITKPERNAEGKVVDVLDPEATQVAQDKQNAIRAEFSRWVWSDPTRADELAGIYNRDFNNLVAPEYDGSYLTTPGIVKTWSWRPHQTRVIARIIQAGNTYMAHGVGAGKTSAMIGAGMEMRRLGLVKKPMYVVPNHMLGQFTKEFYEQYPTARILVADEKSFHTGRRKQFVADMAVQELDAVIMTHSSFGFIPISEQFSDRMIQQQLDEYRDLLSEVKASNDGDKRITVRGIEQRIEALQQKLSGRMGGKKRDQVFTFEETGVDFLFVDEAHLFRKLDFATRMGQVRGIDPKGSDSSFDLFIKTRYLEEQRPGRNLVLASGTPITNTMAELYSLQRYLQPQALAERQLEQFDAWAGAFGDKVTALEQDPAGGYKSQTRFARFLNVPELSGMVRQVMDVVTSEQLSTYVTRPTLKGGSRRLVVAQPTPDFDVNQQRLKQRMEIIKARKGPPQKGDDIMLSVIGDGRKAAIDMRLVDQSLDRDESSKLELMIAEVARIHKETAKQGFHKVKREGGYEETPYRRGPATQMIFSDLGINGPFPIHKYIKNELARRGIPLNQVAIISDFKTHIQRQRLFNDMNEGKVRVLIGSVPKMGTGVNAQRQLYAIHNLDPQWYPANDEQRNGRGIRQGNENPEIEIIDYSTEGSYDSVMWGLMATKARFIEGFFRGDPTMRTMEDLGEASQYEQASAITTSDPRILTLTGWRQDLQKAELRKAGFEREQYSVRERIAESEHRIDHHTRLIENLRADIAQRQDITGDNFTAKVGADTFTDRGEFGDAVLSMLAEFAADQPANGKKVGEIGGFTLAADTFRIAGEPRAILYLQLNGDRQAKVSAETAPGVSASVAATLRGFEGNITGSEVAIVKARATIEEFTPKLGATFNGQPEIDDLRRRVNELEATLNREADAKNNPPEQAPQQQVSGGNVVDLTQEQRAALGPVLQRRLDALGLGDRIRLETPDSIGGKQWGTYHKRLIKVALQEAADPTWTLDHEAIHAMRALGLFSRTEWNLLVDRAWKNDALRERVQRDYSRLTPDGQREEAVAELFGRFRSFGRDSSFVVRAAANISNFLGAVRDAFFDVRARFGGPAAPESAARLLREMASGRIGSRETGSRSTPRDSDETLNSTAPSGPTVSAVLARVVDEAGNVRAPGRKDKMAEAFDDFRTAMQDRMLPLLRAQSAIERVIGRRLKDNENPYRAEELMVGKVGARLDKLTDEVDLFFESMKRENITPEELESFLYARHAPSRNAYAQSINPEMGPEEGSGMSDIEAAAIMARIGKSGRMGAFERVAARIDKILDDGLQARVDSGLMSQEQADAWRSQWDFYIPLKGFAEIEGGNEANINTGGPGLTIRGAESKQAFGRRSRAADLIAQAILQAQEAIVRSEKNEVLQDFYRWAKLAKDKNFLTIGKVQIRKRINPETGIMEEQLIKDDVSEADKDFTIYLKIDGRPRRVTMNRNNPAAVRVAEAMRRLNEPQINMITQLGMRINRWLSTANTTLNPEFVITNAFRDMQTAMANLGAADIKGIQAATFGGYRRALAASWRGAFKKGGTGEFDQAWTEFTDAGGRVYYNQMQDLSTLQADLTKRFKQSQGRNLSPGSMAVTAKGDIVALFNYIENANLAVENAIRLSAFKAARDRGLSVPQAASLAKNLTVNFNRRGTWGVTVNAFYLFYNASVQGSAVILTAMKHKKVRQYAYGMIAAGAAVNMLNVMMSGLDDDDEPYWDKISEFDKSRNLIIMDPTGSSSHLKIPLPYGYNVFYSVGRAATDLMRGKDVMNTTGHLFGTIMDSFNPIGGSDSIINAMLPTVADPIYDLVGSNRDYANRPIMPDAPQYGEAPPDAQRYWGNVGTHWKAITDTLTDISGGDKVTKGAVDVSPETLEYLFGVVTGAAGTFFDRTLGTAAKLEGMLTGDPNAEIERNDIPFVRKVIGGEPGWYDKAAFYNRLEQVEAAVSDAKEYLKREDEEGFQRFVMSKRDVLEAELGAKEARKIARGISKEKKALVLDKELGKVDDATYKADMKLLRDAEQENIANFNRYYNMTVEQRVGAD